MKVFPIVLFALLLFESGFIHPVLPVSAASSSLVINELEQDPSGADAGNEWVEIYNPTSSTIDITGWKLSNKDDQGTVTLSGEIKAKDVLVYTFDKQWLDNTDEQVTLKDKNGNTIDQTPIFEDNTNDSKCWARMPNGVDTDSNADWTFQTSTSGKYNDGSSPPINGDPVASFTVTPTEGDVDTLFKFDASGSHDPDGDTLTYEWDFGDSEHDTGVKVEHYFAIDDNYMVELIVRDGKGGEAFIREGVEVNKPNQAPTANFAIDPSKGNTKTVFNLDASGSTDPDDGIDSYSWTFGDNTSGTGKTVTHGYSEPGKYTVELTVTDNGGLSHKTQKVITVDNVKEDDTDMENALIGGCIVLSVIILVVVLIVFYLFRRKKKMREAIIVKERKKKGKKKMRGKDAE